MLSVVKEILDFARAKEQLVEAFTFQQSRGTLATA